MPVLDGFWIEKNICFLNKRDSMVYFRKVCNAGLGGDQLEYLARPMAKSETSLSAITNESKRNLRQQKNVWSPDSSPASGYSTARCVMDELVANVCPHPKIYFLNCCSHISVR